MQCLFEFLLYDASMWFSTTACRCHFIGVSVVPFTLHGLRILFCKKRENRCNGQIIDYLWSDHGMS